MTDTDKSTYKQLVYPALGACQEVHKHLGPFLNEYMYQDALAIELSLHGIPFQRGPQRKPNEVFAMGRAGSSEYFLPKRNFGTCTRIVHATWNARLCRLSLNGSIIKPSATCVERDGLWRYWSILVPVPVPRSNVFIMTTTPSRCFKQKGYVIKNTESTVPSHLCVRPISCL